MKQLWRHLVYKLKRPYHLVKTGWGRGLVGQVQFQFPAQHLKIIAVTGTDGKTTSATLIYHLLKTAGFKVGLISTVAAYINDGEIETGLHVTSPDPYQLHRILRRMVDQGVEYAVLEVTSHGAYQYRSWGIRPQLTGLTNINHEHLDYHLDLDHYLHAKTLLLNQSQQVILNADDDQYQAVRAALKHQTDKISTYEHIQQLPTKVAQAIKHRFPEAYNRQNARLAYQVAQILKINQPDLIKAFQTFPQIPGRMQEVKAGQPFRVVVDFAHTPQALKAALTALKEQLTAQKGRLIAVYGSAGLRDHHKRPLMGEVGAEIADLVIFTAEDPRTEDVWSIIRQLKENLSQNLHKVLSVADREKALRFALKQLAKKGDIVAVLGKGHEQSMCYDHTEHPWNDADMIETIIKEK